MGRARTAVAGVIDGVIGALVTVRNMVAGDPGRGEDDGRTPPEPNDRTVGGGPNAPVPGRPGATPGSRDEPDPDADGGDGTGIAPAGDQETDVATADGGGIAASITGTLGTQYEYHKTALRHPIAAQRVHFASLHETSILSTDFLKEALVTASVKRERIDRIREHVEADRTVRDDARAVADVVDWSRTWRYGKYGFLAGRRYRKRLPVADEYAPVAAAVAGGVYGAVSGATDRTLVDVDPDRLFDRIDAVSRVRDDPVTRARVARETLAAVDRRVGGDDFPIDDVLDDDAIAELVTRQGEAVPDEIPRSRRNGAVLEDLIWGDPLSTDRVGGRSRELPPAPDAGHAREEESSPPGSSVGDRPSVGDSEVTDDGGVDGTDDEEDREPSTAVE